MRLILLVAIYWFCRAEGSQTCAAFLGRFAAFDSNFTQCVLKHANPIEFCSKCEIGYNGLRLHYDALLKANDSATFVPCKDIYFSNDKISVVGIVHSKTVSLWEDAHCSECINDVAKIAEISAKEIQLTECIKNNPDPCTKCLQDFSDIVAKYQEIVKNTTGNVCIELEDSMNRTRINWYKKNKCSTPVLSLPFKILSSVFIWSALAFYGGLVVVDKIRTKNAANGEYDRLLVTNENGNPTDDTDDVADNISGGDEKFQLHRTNSSDAEVDPVKPCVSTDLIAPEQSSDSVKQFSVSKKINNASDSSDDELAIG